MLSLLILGGCVFLPACGSSRISRENDRLREENQSLRSQIELLTAQKAEVSAKISELMNELSAPKDASVLAALPRVASIEFGTLTGFYPGDRGKPATSVNVYVRPLDGRQRFTQAVGTLEVEVFLIPFDATDQVGTAAATPRAQLSKRLTPTELREAYRSGLTGTHYEVDLPLDTPLKDRNASILVRASFADAVTGVTHTAEKLVKPETFAPKPAPRGDAKRESASR